MLVIIIGLPGSGKTTLALKKYSDFLIHDDFLFNFYNGEVINHIKLNYNVCLTDPRLCFFKIFDQCMESIEKVIDKNNIKILLFENNPEQCILNKPNETETIRKYSKSYNINNYSSFKNVEIIKVYFKSLICKKES